MIALGVVLFFVACVVVAIRSARRRAGARPITLSAEPSVRLRLRSARKGETL